MRSRGPELVCLFKPWLALIYAVYLKLPMTQTFRTLSNTSLDIRNALAELLLRISQILVGVRKMLHFVVQLLLNLR